MISFVPMTHKELMVAFAFDSYFYMMLYLFVGILSIAMIVIFMIYHRVIARAKPVPKFKFCSYLKLTIPPACEGIILAMIPVLIVLIVVSVSISGHIMELQTPWKKCEGINCTNGIFD